MTDDLLARLNALNVQVAHVTVALEHCRQQRERACELLKRAGIHLVFDESPLVEEIGAFLAEATPP